MPQEIYHLAPLPLVGPRDDVRRDEINRVIGQVNLILEAIGTQLGKLQARDEQHPEFHADLNMNSHRLVNLAPPKADGDAISLGEVTSRGLFSRRTGEPHQANEIILATRGVQTPHVPQPGYAVSFGAFDQAVTTITGGDTSFAGNKNFTGTATMSGTLKFTATTPAAIAANTNNYSPGSGTAFRLSATAPFNVTGLANGSDGRVVLFFNVGANAITLTHEDALSTNINRFHNSTGAGIALAADAAIALWYDPTTQRWRDWSKR